MGDALGIRRFTTSFNRWVRLVDLLKNALNPSSAVVLKLVGGIEPNKCRAGINRTLSYNQ